MKISRPKTEKCHNYYEGDCGNPIRNFFKKGFWKKYDRKRFIKKALKNDELN